MTNKILEFIMKHLKLIFIIFFVSIILCSCAQEIVFSQNIYATVTDKNIKRYSNKDQYMIYTKDNNGKTHVFKDTDSLLLWKYNSSDIYADLEIGSSYNFEVRGLRIPILSEYQNIYKYK